MNELAKLGVIHREALSVMGTVEEKIKNARILRTDVIRSVEDPYLTTGGIAILNGNLAPDGALIKESAFAEDMLV